MGWKEQQPVSWFNLLCTILITKLIDILLVTLHLTTSLLPGTKQCVTPPETWAAYMKVRCGVKWRVSVILGSVMCNYGHFHQCLCFFDKTEEAFAWSFLFHYWQDEFNRVIAGERLSVSETASPALERETKCMEGFYRQSASLSTEAHR